MRENVFPYDTSMFDMKDWEVKPQWDSRDFKFSAVATGSMPEHDIVNSTRYHTVFNQKNGSCTGEAAANICQINTDVVVSGEAAYKNAKLYDTFPDQEGSSGYASSHSVYKHGIPRIELYPRLPKIASYHDFPEFSKECLADMATRKSNGYLQIHTADEYGQAIEQYGAVSLSLFWTESCQYPEYDHKTGNYFMPLPSGRVMGGHQVAGMDLFPKLEYRYLDGKIYKGFGAIANSHGYKYGKNGVSLFPLELLEAKMVDFPVPYCMDARVHMWDKKQAEVIKIDAKPELTMDRTCLPIRAFAEAFDCKVDYDMKTRIIKLTKGIHTAIMQVDNTTMYINGVPFELDIAPYVITIDAKGGQRTFLPVRWAAKAIGIEDFTWDAEGGRVEAFGDKESVVMFIGENHLIRRSL